MVTYKFMGQVPNEQILRYYIDYKIDCFILTSENEGLPVSIMEAESAGIPIVATNVGGIREMIDGNGVLLSANPTSDEVADAIISCIKCSKDEKEFMRKRSYEIWNSKFDAKQNAKTFVAYLKKKYEDVKKIYFLTEGFPYDTSDISFIKSELQELVKNYDVTIYARIYGNLNKANDEMAKENIRRVLGQDYNRVQYHAFIDDWNIWKAVYYGIKYIFDKRIRDEIIDILHSKRRTLIRIWESIKYYGKAEEFYKWFNTTVQKYDTKKEKAMVYSYWNLEPALGVCLNMSSREDIYFATRAHGYDYQDEQWPRSQRKPFSKIIDNLIDEIFFVCDSGKEYEIAKIGKQFMNKYTVRYIGSNSANSLYADYIRCENASSFRIVSCASLIPLKRVDIMIDALEKVNDILRNEQVEWIHFGDGVLRQELEQYAAYKLMGNKL